MQDLLRAVITETHIFERNGADDILEADRASRILVFGPLAQDLLGTLQSRQSLGHLGADLHDLQDRRDQEHEIQVVGNIAAGR